MKSSHLFVSDPLKVQTVTGCFGSYHSEDLDEEKRMCLCLNNSIINISDVEEFVSEIRKAAEMLTEPEVKDI